MLDRMDIAIKRLNLISGSIATTLRKRTVVLRAAGYSGGNNHTVLPSYFYQTISLPDNRSFRPIFMQLLDDINAGREISSSYDCESLFTSEVVENRSEDRTLRAVRYLDAVIRIQVSNCQEQNPIPLNNLKPPLPSDTDSKAIHHAEFLALAAAMHQPFLITEKEKPLVMLAQAFRFADVNDDKVPVPTYLRQRTEVSIEAITQLILSTKSDARRFKVIFDRNRTVQPEAMQNTPNGWFNALTQRDHGLIYMSPTLPRAAMIFCASQIEFQQMNLTRLTEEIRPDFIDRKLTVADVSGVVANFIRLADRFDTCLDNEMNFVLSHELAHGMLRVSSEAQADCMASAIGFFRGQTGLGLFSSLIFPTARGPDYALLGIDSSEAQQLICREKRQLNLNFSAYSTLSAAIQSCERIKNACQ